MIVMGNLFLDHLKRWQCLCCLVSPVRFKIICWNYYTAEANSLHARNGLVTAFALKLVVT